MTDFLNLVIEHWPQAGLIVTVIVGMFLATRYLRTADLKDMRDRIDYLDSQLHALRYRDECYFAYVIYDTEYHRREQIAASTNGWTIEPHTTFLSFRDRWMKERNLEAEKEEIWK